MNEANVRLERGSARVSEVSGAEREPSLADDHLATTRLPPPIPRAPLPSRVASVPPPPMPPLAALAPPTIPAPPELEVEASESSPPAEAVPSLPPPPPVSAVSQRTSWWKALVQSTFTRAANEAAAPSAAVGRNAEARLAQARMGAVFIGASLGLVLIALAVGLRGAPGDWLMAPSVAASIVIARALVAVGILVFALALLRSGERLYTGASRVDGSSDLR